MRLELCGIDGMTESHRRNEFLQIGINRVLIELTLGHSRGEGLAGKIEPVVLKLHATCEESFIVKADRKARVDRPIVFRCELQYLVADPKPGSRNNRRDLNAGGHGLFYILQ